MVDQAKRGSEEEGAYFCDAGSDPNVTTLGSRGGGGGTWNGEWNAKTGGGGAGHDQNP